MLCMETILKVRRLSLKQGLSQRAIAKQLQISRRTVRKYLAIETKEPPTYNRTQTHYPSKRSVSTVFSCIFLFTIMSTFAKMDIIPCTNTKPPGPSLLRRSA